MGLCTKNSTEVDFNEEKHALSANARFCPARLTYTTAVPRQAAAARSQRLPSCHPLFVEQHVVVRNERATTCCLFEDLLPPCRTFSQMAMTRI